jgi:hypothetical protein
MTQRGAMIAKCGTKTPMGLRSLQILSKSLKEDDKKLFGLRINLKPSWSQTLLEIIKSRRKGRGNG